MSHHADHLRRACTKALLDNMPQGLVDAIREALAQGTSRRDILRLVPEGTVTRLMAEAYLDSLRDEGN